MEKNVLKLKLYELYITIGIKEKFNNQIMSFYLCL